MKESNIRNVFSFLQSSLCIASSQAPAADLQEGMKRTLPKEIATNGAVHVFNPGSLVQMILVPPSRSVSCRNGATNSRIS